jgi:hypothetical protein
MSMDRWSWSGGIGERGETYWFVSFVVNLRTYCTETDSTLVVCFECKSDSNEFEGISEENRGEAGERSGCYSTVPDFMFS